jgi:hypothetical protein
MGPHCKAGHGGSWKADSNRWRASCMSTSPCTVSTHLERVLVLCEYEAEAIRDRILIQRHRVLISGIAYPPDLCSRYEPNY